MIDIVFSLMSDIFWGLLSGFIAGVVSVVFYNWYNNKHHTPVIEISDKLIETKKEGNPALAIKIINKTKKELSDIKLEVYGIKNLSPNNQIPLIERSLIAKRELLEIAKFDKKDKNADYAYRVKIDKKDGDIIKEVKKYKQIKISIRMNCPHYGTYNVESLTYEVKRDILDDSYSFNTGESKDCSKSIH